LRGSWSEPVPPPGCLTPFALCQMRGLRSLEISGSGVLVCDADGLLSLASLRALDYLRLTEANVALVTDDVLREFRGLGKLSLNGGTLSCTDIGFTYLKGLRALDLSCSSWDVSDQIISNVFVSIKGCDTVRAIEIRPESVCAAIVRSFPRAIVVRPV